MNNPPKPLAAAYSFHYLLHHSITRPIILERLIPVGVDKDQLEKIPGTLVNMLERAVREQLPTDTLTDLIEEINELPRASDL